MIKRSGLAFGIVIGLMGCGDSVGGFTRQYNAQVAATNAVCDCFESIGFDTREACLEEAGSFEPTAEQEACFNAAYDAYEDEVKPSVDCEVEAFDDATSCVNDVEACDTAAVLACYSAAGDALEACPEPSDEVEAAFDACLD